MSVNEEIEEHSHHAQVPFDKKIAASMAIIAAMLAVVSVLGHILTTEELLHQEKASDQWAYSQAKDIRHYIARAASDVLKQAHEPGTLVARYESDETRYKNDTAVIQERAQ